MQWALGMRGCKVHPFIKKCFWPHKIPDPCLSGVALSHQYRGSTKATSACGSFDFEPQRRKIVLLCRQRPTALISGQKRRGKNDKLSQSNVHCRDALLEGKRAPQGTKLWFARVLALKRPKCTGFEGISWAETHHNVKTFVRVSKWFRKGC